RNMQVMQPYTSDKDVLAKAVDLATKGLRGGGTLNVNATVASSALATLNATTENILAAPQTLATTAQAVQNAQANPLVAIAHDPLFAANAASQDVSLQLGNAMLAQAGLVKGLRFATSLSDGMDAMDSLAAQRRTGAESVAQAVDPINGHLEDDDVQLTAVASRQLAMRELAESTGGFAVTNTNEISLPMQHMMEDIRDHYELAYSPTSTNYDGHFRKIDVKLSRPKIT